MLTAERLRELLIYDAQTGLFTRRITNRRWLAGQVAGSIDVNGHILINVDRVQYRAHRLAWLYTHGRWPANDIDHMNGVRTDNRLENLRDVTRQVNLQNRRTSTAKSKLLGAHQHVDGRWKSAIRHNGRQVHLGYFDTPEEAHLAYIHAKRRLHEGCTI